MNFSVPFLQSSIGKKQIVATTGLVLILFVIGHLAGNLFVYGGPAAYNAYAKKLAGLRPGLYLVEFVLFLIFIVHLFVTVLLVLENIKARPLRYASYNPSPQRSFAAKIMPYTGTFILGFVIWHLLDFTFIDQHGPRSILSDGQSYGLYGVVYNSFLNPAHSGLYILAMMCVGFHLAHGVQSFFQTFGFNHPVYFPWVKKISNAFGVLIAVGYSSIPIYVLFR